MNNESKVLVTLALLLMATVVPAQNPQVKTPTLSAGAARLDNGSLVNLGQPFVGMMSAPGGAVSISSGLLPALLQEKIGSEPLVITPAVSFAGDRFQFCFPTQPGRNYVVQASTNLSSWTLVWTNAGTWTGLIFEDTDAWQFSHRFYRMSVP